MRLNNHSFFTFFLLTCLLLFAPVLQAQNSKKLDSIIKVNTMQMYGNPDKAIIAGKEVLNKAGDDVDLKIRAYKLISDGYSSKRDYKKSLEYVIKANQLLPQTQNKLLKISMITKAGIQYHQLKIYDKSIEYLDQAEKLCLEYPVRDSVYVNLGTNYMVRGLIYKEKLNCEIAIEFLDKGIYQISQTKNINANANRLSIAKYNKGNCYILMSDNLSARKSFQEAIDYAKRVDALSLQAFAQKGLAEVYTIEGKYNEAIALLQNALKISSEVNDLILNQGIYKGLADNYLAINEWDNYQECHSKYLKTQTEVKKRERDSASDSLIELGNDENKKLESVIPNFLFGSVLLILILIGVVVLFLFSIRKSKITLKNLELTIKNLQNEKPKE
ncbi:MAG: tetratricopeptide repeat protein [Bacteroidota bacterium]